MTKFFLERIKRKPKEKKERNGGEKQFLVGRCHYGHMSVECLAIKRNMKGNNKN